MICIVPCAGNSTRYSGLKKQFLMHPTGLPLPIYSTSGIKTVGEFVYVFNNEDFEANGWNIEWFRDKAKSVGQSCNIILLNERTHSQVETVCSAVNIVGVPPIGMYIKDCDNYFELAPLKGDSVAVTYANEGKFELRNKSYTKGVLYVEDIAEKRIISDKVNVGGYGFATCEEFLLYCNGNQFETVSEVINHAKFYKPERFKIQYCQKYEDYGTLKDWIEYLKTFDN